MEETKTEEKWSHWCTVCHMTSHFSESNPYGTCQCS